MLTPQDIKEKTFSKAIFGGYDMNSVDEFLETVMEDYSNLLKESAILKSKIKVLVDKVEEYRSTEDAMRMALMTAQKMGDDIIEEAKKKSDETLAALDAEVAGKREALAAEFANEQARLDAAKEQTEKFVRASEEIMRQHAEFLSRLESITCTTMEDLRDDAEVSDEPAAEESADDLNDTIKEIDRFVTEAVEKSEEKEAEDIADQPTVKFAEWDSEDESSPRPKFDFENLKFGANYFED